MPPPTQRTQSLDLSDAEQRALEQFAQERGITVDEAATQLARQSIERRYVRRKQVGNVVPIKTKA